MLALRLSARAGCFREFDAFRRGTLADALLADYAKLRVAQNVARTEFYNNLELATSRWAWCCSSRAGRWCVSA